MAGTYVIAPALFVGTNSGLNKGLHAGALLGTDDTSLLTGINGTGAGAGDYLFQGKFDGGDPSAVGTHECRFDFTQGGACITLDGTGAAISYNSLPAGFTPVSAQLVVRNNGIITTGSTLYLEHGALDLQTVSGGLTWVARTYDYDFTPPFEPSMLDLINNGFGVRAELAGANDFMAWQGAYISGAYEIQAVTNWWCNDTHCIYTGAQPGPDYATATPTTASGNDGWWVSDDNFAGAASVIHNSRPKAPRQWTRLAAFATGANAVLGGSPAASAVSQNRFFYPDNDYSLGTGAPHLRIASGESDRLLATIPPDASLVPAKAVMSLLAAGGTVYASTLDATGGRVLTIDRETGLALTVGSPFAQVPYALAWHMGRLWVGTNNGNATAGKIYWMRPGIDTDWTLDLNLTSGSLGGACAMQSFQGKLYVGTDSVSGAFGTVIVRDTAGAWTGSTVGTGGTGALHNGCLTLTEWSGSLFAGFWNPLTTPEQRVERFDGLSWTNVFALAQSGASGARAPLGLYPQAASLLMLGGGASVTPSLWRTATGLTGSWTDVTAFIPDGTATAVPMCGKIT